MDTYHVVLYLHLMALFVGIGAGATLLTCLIQLRAADTAEQAAPWGMMAGKVEKFFPIAIIGLFATGAYMTSKLWTWDTGWIDAAIVGLVYLALVGPLVGGRTGHKLKQTLMANGPGPLGDEARRMARHPGLWMTELTNLFVVFAIVWNMTNKPGTWTAYAAMLIAAAVGVAVALPLTRVSTPAAAAAPEVS